ncbi:MAG: hypothetical protein AB7S38_07450 [Vulcanimicrobiota bacterium]
MHPELAPLYRSEHPEQSVLALKRFLLVAKSRGDAALCAELLGLVARCQWLAGELDAAQESLNDVEFVLIDSKLRGGQVEARYLMERALWFAACGLAAPAAKSARESLALAEEPLAGELEALWSELSDGRRG